MTSVTFADSNGAGIGDFGGLTRHVDDLAEFMAVARDRGPRVIADLVVNHTSDQHRWFHPPAHVHPGDRMG